MDINDKSELNRKYFLDGDTYNCPFCNRHSIVYSIRDSFSFDWSKNKAVYGYIVMCHGCNGISLHLSYHPLNSDKFTLSFEFRDKDGKLAHHKPEADNLDKYFFYHQPDSFFTLDERIPKIIRELVSEADGCRRMNWLVGASGALRKATYKFLQEQGSTGNSYEEQIKWLKTKHSLVASEYFDALSNIQGMTSEELHEDKDWEPWTREEFDFLVATVKAVLHEVYVVPDERKSMLAKVLYLGPEKKNSQTSQKA